MSGGDVETVRKVLSTWDLFQQVKIPAMKPIAEVWASSNLC